MYAGMSGRWGLRDARHARLLSQAELGALTGVSGPTVSKWEAGYSDPADAFLPKLAAALGVTERDMPGLLIMQSRPVGTRVPPDAGDDVTAETIAELVRRYATGQGLESLAWQYRHLSYRKIRTLLVNAGVTLRPTSVALPPAPPGLGNAYRDGRSIRHLAEKHGMSYSQTRRVLLAIGVELRSRGNGRPVGRDEGPTV